MLDILTDKILNILVEAVESWPMMLMDPQSGWVGGRWVKSLNNYHWKLLNAQYNQNHV